jgi:hypothetical protein
MIAKAEVCDPAQLQGTYAMQMSGTTTLGGYANKRVAAIGRLSLDGKGAISGVSSVNFAGYFLGHPVTGSYEANTDCTVIINLQDDSGAFQHLLGTYTSDARQVRFRQAEAGVTMPGTLIRTGNSCSNSLEGRYVFAVSGDTVELDTGRKTGSVSVNGFIEANADGSLKAIPDRTATVFQGTYHAEDDCFFQIELPLPVQGTQSLMKFRAIATDGGKQILAVRSDPATAVILRMNLTN